METNPTEPRRWGQRSSLYELAVGAVVLLAGLFALRRFNDFDVFWHVRTGDWILGGGGIPRTDPFGSMTSSEPWLAVSWAADVIGALLVRAIGFVGLQLVIVAVITTTLAVVLHRAPRTPLILAAALLLVLTCWMRLLVRPDILSLPLTVLLIVLVDRLPRSPRPAQIGLTALAIVWANVHGSFILVPLVLAAALLGSLFSRDAVKTHALALGAAIAGTWVTPYGLGLYALFEPYLRSMLSLIGAADPVQRVTLVEWQPTWQAAANNPAFLGLPLALLIAALALSFVVRGARLPLGRLVQAVALLLLGVTAARHILPFSAAALGFIALNERDRLARSGPAALLDRPRVRQILSAAVLLVGLLTSIGVMTDRFYVRLDVPLRTGLGVDTSLLPEGAVQWLARNRPAGKVFNNFDSGAWLHHRLYPEFKPYLDARLVSSELYFTVRDAVGNAQAFDALVERDGIGTLVLVHPSRESLLLLPRLTADPGWTLAFRDENSTVHVRADLPAPAPRTPPRATAPMSSRTTDRINGWLAQLKTHRLPAAELTDAFVSGLIGDDRRRDEAYRRAAAVAPDNPKVREFFAGDSP